MDVHVMVAVSLGIDSERIDSKIDGYDVVISVLPEVLPEVTLDIRERLARDFRVRPISQIIVDDTDIDRIRLKDVPGLAKRDDDAQVYVDREDLSPAMFKFLVSQTQQRRKLVTQDNFRRLWELDQHTLNEALKIEHDALERDIEAELASERMRLTGAPIPRPPA